MTGEVRILPNNEIIKPDEVRILPDKKIIERCDEETQRYIKEHSCDDRFCFEVLRRMREEGANVRSGIRNIYTPVVLGMIIQYRTCNLLPADAIDSVMQKVLNEWMDKLEAPDFELRTLPAALKFLKKRTAWRLWDALRDQRKKEIPTTSIDEFNHDVIDPADQPDIYVERHDIQSRAARRLRELLSDPKDRQLCYLRFGERLKPAEIVRDFPKIWPHVDLIYKQLPKLRKLLYNDPILRQLGDFKEK